MEIKFNMDHRHILQICYIIAQIFLAYLGLKETIFKSGMVLWKKIVGGLAVFIIIVFSFVYQYLDEEATKRDATRFQSEVINAVVSNKINNQDLEELIALKYKDVYESSNEDAKAWAENFVSTLPEREKQKADLTQRGNDVANSFKLKWEPLYKYLLQQIDSRIQILKDRGLISSVSVKRDLDLVQVNKYTQIDETVRQIEFLNGNELSIHIEPANVDMGALSNPPSINVLIKIAQGTFEEAVVIQMFPNYTNFGSDSSGRFSTTIPYYQTTDDPLKDKKYLETMDNSINIIFDYIV